MNQRLTIWLTYITFFLWIWMVAAVGEEFPRESKIAQAPMFGFILTAWVLVRLERMARQSAKTKAEECIHGNAEKPPGVRNQ